MWIQATRQLVGWLIIDINKYWMTLQVSQSGQPRVPIMLAAIN